MQYDRELILNILDRVDNSIEQIEKRSENYHCGDNLFNEKRNIIREQDASFSPFFFVLSILIFLSTEVFLLSTDYHRFYLGTEIHGFFRAVSIRA